MKQYKNFKSIKNFNNKIIQAINYYNKKGIKVNSSELVILLNEILLKKNEKIKLNKNILGQIQLFYLKLNIQNSIFIKLIKILFKNGYYKENKKILMNII